MVSQLVGLLVLVVAGVTGPGAAPAEGFRVLGLFPFNGRSHNIMFKAMMEALADRGHEVVNLSPFPLKKPRANYTDLDLSAEFPSLVNALTFEQMANPDVSKLGILNIIEEVAGSGLCRKVFATKHFQDIMSGVHGQFDVVFTEIFGSDCWVAVAYKMKIPLISMVSAPDFTWAGDRTGSVDNPSFVAGGFLDNMGRMSFWERLENTYSYVLAKYLHQRWIQDPSDVVVREVFGADTPPISELVRLTSLVMLNRHEALNPARPVNPNVIHVGGLHLRPVKPNGAGLEPGLRAWMDGAEHGVIFFSLGSLVRTSSLPKEKILALRDAFAALPQRVLWKFETSDIEDLPPNVRIASWLPQMDILAHPKTVLFITHGGLMGTIEAVFAGVPMLGIPLFADQYPNIALYKSLGIAERLHHTAITKEGLLAAIRELTATDRYRVRAREISARYRDRPRWATEEAVWWTEYVVRHGGAPHLRPLGADMPLYQYLLLDVLAFVLAVILAGLLAAWLLVKRLCCSSSSPAPRPKRKRN